MQLRTYLVLGALLSLILWTTLARSVDEIKGASLGKR